MSDLTLPATSIDDRRLRPWLFGLLVLLTVYRLLVLGSGIPLFFDEAQYYGWSLQPDFGYYSKPPVLAWLIAATTAVAGNSELGVRLASPLLYAGAAFLVYGMGRRLFGEMVGVAAALVVITMPGVGLSALFITADAPLMFFWALTAYCFLRARDSAGWGWWLAAGVAGGLGLMSKYTMGALALSLLLYLAGSPRYRPLLRDVRLWVAALTAALVFAPNLWWNYQNQFATVVHTAEISHLDRELLRPGVLAEFLAGQLLVLGPVLGVALLVLVARLWRRSGRGAFRADDGLWFAVSLTLPLLALISLQALLAKANANWAMPAFLGGALLTAALMLRADWQRWLAAGLALNLLLAMALYHFHTVAPPVLNALGLSLSAKTDPYSRLLGWPELGRAAARFVAQAPPDTLVLADNRRLLANLVYYGQVPPQRLVVWNPDGEIRSHYHLTGDLGPHLGADVLALTGRPLPEDVLARFKSATAWGKVSITVYPDLKRELHVYHLRDFQGYP